MVSLDPYSKGLTMFKVTTLFRSGRSNTKVFATRSQATEFFNARVFGGRYGNSLPGRNVAECYLVECTPDLGEIIWDECRIERIPAGLSEDWGAIANGCLEYA